MGDSHLELGSGRGLGGMGEWGNRREGGEQGGGKYIACRKVKFYYFVLIKTS